MIKSVIKCTTFKTKKHIVKMAQTYIFLALIIQSVFVFGTHVTDNEEPEGTREDLKRPDMEISDGDDEVVQDFRSAPKDWMDMFTTSQANIYPSSSVAMMSVATENSGNKTAEEQIKEIQSMAAKITSCIEREMVNMLQFVMNGYESKDGVKDNNLRRKRESPMDSAEMVMRLLNHIKSNNEYQNIAIEKMMSAQEIADKYNIEFSPDPEILSDLAEASNNHAKELTSLLEESCGSKNATVDEVHFVPLEQECKKAPESTYYVYSVNHTEEPTPTTPTPSVTFEPFVPEPIISGPMMHDHHYYPYEPHHHHHPPTSPNPSFYDSFLPDYYETHCAVEPITTTIILPLEDIFEPEPELIGEEYEEIVSSKVTVDHEEPGVSTVNHVMTYTLSEKSHFRTPQIEELPQQLQYTFFLI